MNEKQKLADAEIKLKAALDATNEEKKREEEKMAAKVAAINKRDEQFKREQKVVQEKAFTRAVIWTPFSFVDKNGDDGNAEGDNDRSSRDQG